MKKVLCFGELLLRICPDVQGNWIQNHQMSCYVGGAELNVATALALWKKPVAYVSALPDNFLATQIINHLESLEIDCSNIVRNGSRIGTYYLPQGTDLKNTEVIYDRVYSSFAELNIDSLDWESLFKDIQIFHFSAICPALNDTIAVICKQAIKYAQSAGIFISLDFNYRAKLWQYGKSPSAVMPDLTQGVNLIMGNIWSTSRMLGYAIPAEVSDQVSKEEANLLAQKLNNQIFEDFPACKFIANTFRFDVGRGLRYFASYATPEQQVLSKSYYADSILDKVGSGDCFMAGLLYGLLEEYSLQDTVDYAAAAAFSKLFISRDATNLTPEVILNSVKKYEQN
ncbi:MAG: sugar kinase [Pedobacter sp.]|nr:MAG: sugar kinase [Pedobacter sp.]